METSKDLPEREKLNNDHAFRHVAFTAKLRDPEYREKFICTVFLFWNFLYIGMYVGLAGPAFLDLMLITNTELDQASALFTANGVGYTVGALISGVLYEKSNKLLFLGVVVLGNSICIGVKPLCYSFPVMVTVTLTASLFAGGMETGGNAELIRLWGSDGKSYMQILHFFFALGGVVSPLIVEPFLAPRSINNTHPPAHVNQVTESITYEPILTLTNRVQDQNIINASLYHSLQTTNVSQQITNMTMNLINESTTPQNQTSISFIKPESRILFAYMIVASVGIANSFCFFVEFFIRRADKTRKTEVTSAQIEQEVPLWVTVTCVAMIGLFFHCYVAAEDMFMSYLTVFTVEGLSWTKTNGALATSVFWATLALGRFLGIFLVRFISSMIILVSCLILIVVSLCSFMVVSLYNLTVGIWISTVGIGLAMSVVFPTGMSWVEEHVIRITAKVTSVILMATSLSGVIMPLLLGYLMEHVTFMSYPYFLVFESVLLFCLFISIKTFSKHVVSKYRRESYCDTIERATLNTQL